MLTPQLTKREEFDEDRDMDYYCLKILVQLELRFVANDTDRIKSSSVVERR